LPAAFEGEFTSSALVPLVLLHGFTQTGQSWAPVVDALAGRFPLVLPDAPGHGRASEVRADLWETARLLTATVGRRASWVGYSMGGRMALHLALAYPALVQRLVLISATAGIEDEAERRARRDADNDAAARLERDGVARFLSSWLHQPMFATLSDESAGMEARLTNSPTGLASSLRLAGTGASEPLWSRLNELAGKHVLLITGGRDEKYCQIARRMATAMGPLTTLLVVPGAGHACHLEHPIEVATAIAGFCGGATSTSPADATGPSRLSPPASQLERQPDGK